MAFTAVVVLVIICVFEFGQTINAENKSKRLILDGDATLDLGAEINKLRTQFLDFQNATNTKLAELQKENKDLKQTLVAVSQAEGQAFVRWGRNDCPPTANFLYNGFMAGKHYNSKGSGTNHLCLPRDPTWLNYTDGVNKDYKAFIFGTEIDTDDNQHIFGYPVNEQDMPCAVCQSKHRTTMMIPARGSCYSGWTQEYRGYLMAGHDGNYAYEYICVDEQPEFLNGGYTNDDQHIMYITEARCGSLPCPPYVDGRELACVVCSK